MENIKMPVYYWEDEKTKEKHYDFEEMANELENRISDKLGKNTLITISEVEKEEPYTNIDNIVNDMLSTHFDLKFHLYDFQVR